MNNKIISINSVEELLAVIILAQQNKQIWDYIDIDNISIIITYNCINNDKKVYKKNVIDFYNNATKYLKKIHRLYGLGKNEFNIAYNDGLINDEILKIDLTDICINTISNNHGKNRIIALINVLMLFLGFFYFNFINKNSIKYMIRKIQQIEGVNNYNSDLLVNKLGKLSCSIFRFEYFLKRNIFKLLMENFIILLDNYKDFYINSNKDNTFEKTQDKYRDYINLLNNIYVVQMEYMFQADGEYEILAIDLKNEQLTLKQNNITMLANVSYNTIKGLSFWEDIKQYIIDEKHSLINLNYHYAYDGYRCEIVGFDKPRININHVKLKDIPENIPITALITESETE